MADAWTIEDVAARFEEAPSTGRRLPPVRVQGYFNMLACHRAQGVGDVLCRRDGLPTLPAKP
jgi:hypothetical protein